MSGSQVFILVFLLGGAISGAIFLMGLGVYIGVGAITRKASRMIKAD